MRFRRAISILAAAAAIPMALASCGGGDKGPNVLFIIVDTLRADHLRCYGYRDIRTPHIDRLASRGVKFADVVTSSPVTAPSVATLITGTYPTLHEVRDNELFALSPSLPKLAGPFKEAGYRTAGFVASMVLDRRYGFADGFDHYDDDMSGEFPVYSRMYATQVEQLQGTQRRAEDVTAAALEWIEGNKRGGPFMCMVHYFDPHLYYDPPPPFDDRYFMAPYDGEVAYTDAQIGVLLNGLDESGLEEETLVVFTSDHGEDLLQHGEGSHGFFLYDATVAVPLIFSRPGELPAGVTISTQVTTADVMPTILDLAGLAVPETVQGRSLAAAVMGTEELEPTQAYIETFHTLYSYRWHEMQALRTGDWKYVRAPVPELYDLRNDPGEVNNLAESRTDRLAEFEAMLATLEEGLSHGPGHLRAELAESDDEITEKMMTLGYLGTPKRDKSSLPEPGGNYPDPKMKMREWNSIQEARTYLRTALALQKRGDLTGALHAIAAAESIAPEYAEVPATKGLIVKRSGDLEGGIELMEKAIEMDDRSEMVHQTLNNLGFAYLEKGNCDKAISALKRSVEAKPDYHKALYNLAATLEKCGRLDEAADAYARYLEVNPPRDPDAMGFLTRKIEELRAGGGSLKENESD